MTSAWIRRRKTGAGKTRYQVLYRVGGRETGIQSAGTFDRDDAKARRDTVAGWLARGLDPRLELAKLTVERAAPRSFRDTALAMIASRVDAADSTVHGKQKALDKIVELRPDLAAKAPARWTVADVQELVAAMVDAGLKPSTIDKYLTDGPKLVLEFADVTPNPARDRRVKLPSQVRPETSPPDAREVRAIAELLTPLMLRAFVVLESTAMRVGELESLTWQDVDVAGCRFRLSRERVKTRHPRWVQLPDWLMEIVAVSCPQEDRVPDRRVFNISSTGLRGAMRRACRDAGLPLYSPHDLRHRRASLWHGQGVTTRDLMDRGGWTRSELPVDLYSHVMPLDEVTEQQWKALIEA